jgi:signal transduction histidine kinase
VDDSGRNGASQAGSAPVLQEASRVARELHDGLAQSLFAIAATAKELRDRRPLEPSALRAVETILGLAQAGSRQLREAFGPLGGAGSVVRRGLGAAIAELRAEAREIIVEAAVEPDLEGARGLAGELLYRACREGVANAARHARASRCRVRCRVDDGFATATVEDDGTGVDADASRGFGLRFLAELLEGAGGGLEIRSSRRGTRLTARMPLER